MLRYGCLDQLEQKLNFMMLTNDPSRLDRLESTMDSITKSIDKLTQNLDKLMCFDIGTVGSVANLIDIPLHCMKLDFSRFDGLELLNWLFRAEKLFGLYQTLDSQ